MPTFTVTKLIRTVLVAAVAAFAAQAENFDLIQAPVTAADWTNPDFYRDGRAPTGISSDVVRTTISKKLAISIDGNADDFPAITNFLNSIYAFSFSGATITFIVPAGRKVSLTRPFYSSNSPAELGTVYKYGAGDLSLEAVRILSPSSTSSTDYQGEWKVMEGTLHILPNAPEGGYWWVMDYNYVAEGAKIVIPATGGSGAWQILELEGAGLVTNESVTVAARVYKNASARKDFTSFAGVIGPNISFAVRSSSMEFQNAANRGTITTGTTNGKNYTGTLYLRKLGNVADQESSMGPGSVTTPNKFVYTGLGETSDRQPYVHSLESVISGGTNGNLHLTGTIGSHWSSERQHAALTLDGDNLYTCFFDSPINSWTTDNNASTWDVYLEKTGRGQWNLNSIKSTTAGTVAIKDGVLGCTLLGRRGEVSTLGTSTNCHERVQQYSAENAVDYAIMLGDAENAAATGLLANVSADAMMMTDRPFALAGNGGFRQNAGEGAVKYAGIRGLGGGAKTLVLDGTSQKTNQVYDVADGDGVVSVLKRGSGTWLMGGDLSFSGDLTVAGGTLVVKRAPEGKYGFYRLAVCEVANHNPDYYEASQYWASCAIELVQVGLWAEDHTRQNMNLRFVRSGELEPGCVAFGWNRTISGGDNAISHGFSLVELLFAGCRAPKVRGPGETDYTQIWNLFSRTFFEPGKTTANDGGPARDNPYSWLNIDMCLAEDAAPVAFFDVACGGGNTSPFYSHQWVTAIKLMGSVDGVHWEDLSDICDGQKPTGTYNWISDATSTYAAGGGCTAGDQYDASNPAKDWHKDPKSDTYKRTNGSGFAVTNSAPIRKFRVLENVGKVKVMGGGTLKFEGERRPEVSSLEVDPLSGGTLDGFALAATGTLNLPLDNFDGQSLTLPLGFANMDVSALANWHLSMNGVTKLRSPRMAYRNGSLVVFKSGISISFR